MNPGTTANRPPIIKQKIQMGVTFFKGSTALKMQAS